MNRRLWLVVAAAIAWTTVPAAEQRSQPPAPAGRRFALLVGVTEVHRSGHEEAQPAGPCQRRRAVSQDALEWWLRHPDAAIVSLAASRLTKPRGRHARISNASSGG
jgi:hypothetical protein